MTLLDLNAPTGSPTSIKEGLQLNSIYIEFILCRTIKNHPANNGRKEALQAPASPHLQTRTKSNFFFFLIKFGRGGVVARGVGVGGGCVLRSTALAALLFK